MGKPMNLIGQKFGRLTVIKIASPYISPKGHRLKKWECICECGNTTFVSTHELINGKVKSCGCLQKDLTRERFSKHGQSNSRLYNIWKGMIARCYNKKTVRFDRYGGRGISVCDEWRGEQGVLNFIEWAERNGYREDLTLDRIDNDGNYCPENCRWGDRYVQCNNTSRNTYITAYGETHTIAEWSRITGLDVNTICRRIYKYHFTGNIVLTKSMKEVFNERKRLKRLNTVD